MAGMRSSKPPSAETFNPDDEAALSPEHAPPEQQLVSTCEGGCAGDSGIGSEGPQPHESMALATATGDFSAASAHPPEAQQLVAATGVSFVDSVQADLIAAPVSQHEVDAQQAPCGASLALDVSVFEV